MTPAFHETIVCNWCGRARQKFRIHPLETGQAICDYCLDWHRHAMDFLGGAPPRGCQGCCHSWEEIKAAAPGEQVRMYVVPKDGLMQLLCARCVKPYLPQTKELYKGTQFGHTALKIA